MALGLASASLADEATEQWAPATYESTGPTAAAAAAAVPAASAPGGSEYHVQQYNQYPPAAAQTPAQVRADPNGQLAAASMVRSMRDSLADISGRVGRGFSSAQVQTHLPRSPHPIPFSLAAGCCSVGLYTLQASSYRSLSSDVAVSAGSPGSPLQVASC